MGVYIIQKSIALSSLLITVIGTAVAAECPFEAWKFYEGTQLYRNADTGAYLYMTSRAAIDADGAPRAYHPDDIGTCGATGTGLDCPANAGYPSRSWWPSVLARDPAQPDKAYVQPSGPSAGFFVSKTALTDRDNGNERDPKRYVDASTIPYLVFPGPFYDLSGTGKMGDLGVAYHLTNRNWTPFIVADVGPSEPLGESSIALFKGLGGSNPNPRNGSGIATGRVMYVVFPYSVDARPSRWPMTDDEIAEAANAFLDRNGGQSLFEDCRR